MQKFEPELIERATILFLKRLIIAAALTVFIGGSIILGVMLNSGFIEL